jgi:hypothetical protein
LFDAIDAMQQTQVCAYKCVAVKFFPENNMIFGNFAAGQSGICLHTSFVLPCNFPVKEPGMIHAVANNCLLAQDRSTQQEQAPQRGVSKPSHICI